MRAGISDPFRSHASGEIIVLLGTGGSGKTQLALDFYRQAEEDLSRLPGCGLDKCFIAGLCFAELQSRC